MTRRHRTNPTRSRFAAALGVVVALLAIGLPASTTGANLTNTKTVTSSTTPVGDWCSVPGSSQFKNVYRLNDTSTFESVTMSGTTFNMAIVPVANDGSFDPVEAVAGDVNAGGAIADQLGVRLWGCGQPLTTGLNVKATAWRGTYTTVAGMTWKGGKAPVVGSFASARLSVGSAASGVGAELRDLHRGTAGATTGSPNPTTMRYTWLLDHMRKKDGTLRSADPACVTPSNGDARACTVARGNGVIGGDAFSVSDSQSLPDGSSGNSATYLGEKYYAQSGNWPTTTTQQPQCDRSPALFGFPLGRWSPVNVEGTACPDDTWVYVYRDFRMTTVEVPSATALAAPTTLPRLATTNAETVLKDTTGDIVQYVVLEWWGTLPSQNLAVEVFVER